MLTSAGALWWISGLLSFVLVGFSGGWVADWLKRRGLVDRPDQARRMHDQTTPRGGGVLIAGSLALILTTQMWLLGTWVEFWPLGLFVVLASAMGWLEDVRPRPIRYRLLGQFVLALAVVFFLGTIDSVGVGQWVWFNSWLWSALGVLAIVWLMNLHNFMDGADGLAASQGIWSAACYAAVFFNAGQVSWALMAVAVIGAYGGFLIWNRPVARIFMGDSGSLLLGALVGLFAYQAVGSGAASLLACLMISAVFVVDATATLLWRVLTGQRWYTSHASHAFQRLIAGGLSHAQVLGIYVTLNLGLVLPAFIGAWIWPDNELWFGLGLIFVLVFGWRRIQRHSMTLGLEG